jgi:hypothetical protein
MNMLKKTLLATALVSASVAANAAPGECRSTSYYVQSLPTQIGVFTKVGLNVKEISAGGSVATTYFGQDFNLNAADCTYTSSIYTVSAADGRADLFALSGSWAYPEGALGIYFTLDGDISQGVALDPASTTWGRLLAGDLRMNVFMNLLYGDPAGGGDGSVKSFTVVTPTATMKSGFLKPGPTATTSFEVIGKAHTTVAQLPNPLTGAPKPDKIKIQNWSLKSVIYAATMTVVP